MEIIQTITKKHERPFFMKTEREIYDNQEIIEIHTADLSLEPLPDGPIRLGDNEDAIANYMEIPKRQRPPVIIARCPEDLKLHGKIIDGRLQLLAAIRNDEKTIRCIPIPVKDRKTAYRLAVEANCKHGKQLSGEEKHEIIKVLNSHGYRQTDIAKILGIHRITVYRVLKPKEQSAKKPAENPNTLAAIAKLESSDDKTLQLQHETGITKQRAEQAIVGVISRIRQIGEIDWRTTIGEHCLKIGEALLNDIDDKDFNPQEFSSSDQTIKPSDSQKFPKNDDSPDTNGPDSNLPDDNSPDDCGDDDGDGDGDDDDGPKQEVSESE